MSKSACPAGCGKRFVTSDHAEAHANREHTGWDDPANVRRKGWVTPYGFGDWEYPITYAEACEQMKAAVESFPWPKGNEIEDEAGNV